MPAKRERIAKRVQSKADLRASKLSLREAVRASEGEEAADVTASTSNLQPGSSDTDQISTSEQKPDGIIRTPVHKIKTPRSELNDDDDSDDDIFSDQWHSHQLEPPPLRSKPPSYSEAVPSTLGVGQTIIGATQPAVPLYPNNLEHTANNNQQPQVWHTGQSTTVVVNQAPLRPPPIDYIQSDEPVHTICHNCGDAVITYLYFTTGVCTYCACVLLMLVGCDFGCCLCPFAMDRFKDVTHKCPKCHVILGKYKRM